MTAAEVKAALRRRHPATQGMGARTVPGPWTCIEELLGCDLVAFSAHQRAATNGVSRAARYPRVGYEVKVSRSDYRREIRNTSKRDQAVAYCHHFYFAVPADLLTAEEIARERGNLCVPPDVGLIVVTGSGCHVAREAPLTLEPRAIEGAVLAKLVRFVSAHPDPRHEGVVAADRAHCKELREAERAWKAAAAERREAWSSL